MDDVGELHASDHEAREREIQENVRRYSVAVTPVLRDLDAAGFGQLCAVQDLRTSGFRYAAAIPILVDWMPRVKYDALKEDIIRTLSVPWAKAAVPALLAEFKRDDYGLEPSVASNPNSHIRWCIGNALEVLASDDIFEDLREIACDSRWGVSRTMVVLGLGKMKRHPEAVPVLVSLLDDEVAAPMAVVALSKLKAAEAAPYVERFTAHPSDQVRRAARKVLLLAK